MVAGRIKAARSWDDYKFTQGCDWTLERTVLKVPEMLEGDIKALVELERRKQEQEKEAQSYE